MMGANIKDIDPLITLESNEKQTKVHLNSLEKLSLTWGPLHSSQSDNPQQHTPVLV